MTNERRESSGKRRLEKRRRREGIIERGRRENAAR